MFDALTGRLSDVFRKLSEASHGNKTLGVQQRKHLILDAAVEVGRPTLFSMLIIIAAHIPIFTLQRHEGRIFAPMAYSVVSALVGALILSLTLVPLLCAVMLRKNLPEKENFLVRAAKKASRGEGASWARVPKAGAGAPAVLRSAR